MNIITQCVIKNDEFDLVLLDNGIDTEIINNFNKKIKIFQEIFHKSKEKLDYISDEKYQAITKDITQEYQSKINKLEYELEQYKISINDEVENRLQLHKLKYENESKDKLNEKDKQIIQLETELKHNDNIKDIRLVIDKHFTHTQTNQEKGEIGELFIYDYLNKLFKMCNNFNLERVQGQTSAGDMFLQFDNIKCCVESKNHSGAIGSNELSRFLKTDVQNQNYNCGLFISYKSGFTTNSGISHFDIKIENDKPCIFLCNIKDNESDIDCAFHMLKYFINNDINSKDNIKLFEQIKKDRSFYQTLEKQNNKHINELTKSNISIIDKIRELNKLLNIEDTKFICEKCDKEYKTQKALTKHFNSCAK